uniref:FERM domain-containing protein n=1 Tax=Glossina austeni TaxID=7395 RepID=A0A1A9VH48_GLOAU
MKRNPEFSNSNYVRVSHVDLKKAMIGPPYTFRLKAKFYSSEPITLREELTCYLFFLQLKHDLLEGRLDCPDDKAAELCALALQCKLILCRCDTSFYPSSRTLNFITSFLTSRTELVDFDEEIHTAATVSEFRFVPDQTEDLKIAILEEHKTCRGLTPAQTETAHLN